MVSHLFFYQLVLIALVWLCLMLQWMWPSAAAPCPTPPEPTPPVPKRKRERKPFAGLTTKPYCDACAHASDPHPQAPSAPPPRHMRTRGRRRQSTPPPIAAPTRTVPIAAGSDGVISAPTAIPMVVPGGSCCASPVATIVSRLSARFFMVSTLPSSSSCVCLRAWPRDWISGGRRGCLTLTRIRCCSGSSKRQSSCRPSPDTSYATCGSGRCNSMNSSPCSAR
jgi:hypothetical protein